MHSKNDVLLINFWKNSASQIKFLWEVRTNPLVSKNLTKGPPVVFWEHAKYLYETSKKIWIISAYGECIGYAQAGVVNNEIEVGWAILPEFWNKGFGSSAVRQTILECKKIYNNSIILWVKKDNVPAIRIYKKHGFNIVNETSEQIKMRLEQ